MTWTIFLAIKIIFGAILYKLYKSIKRTSLDIQYIERIIANVRKKIKRLYLLFFGLLTLSVGFSIGYENWKKHRPLNEKIVGTWQCYEGIDKLVFYENSLFEMGNDNTGTWTLKDSILTLEFIDETNDYWIYKLTSHEIKFYSTEDIFVIKCKR